MRRPGRHQEVFASRFRTASTSVHPHRQRHHGRKPGRPRRDGSFRSSPSFQRRQSEGVSLPLGPVPATIHQSLRLSKPSAYLIRSAGSATRELSSFATAQLHRCFPNVADSTHNTPNDISQDRVIVLRSFETFTVVSTDGRGDSEFATHTSCPLARSISIVLEGRALHNDAVVVEILPATVYWDTFVSTRKAPSRMSLSIWNSTKSSPPLRSFWLELRSHR